MILFRGITPFRSKNAARKPFRAEILSRELLQARAIELAEFYSQTQQGGRGAKLRVRFRENCKILNSTYFAFSEAAQEKLFLAPGADWLLDNYHVIDEQVREIRRDLPHGYYRALPKLSAADWEGLPRVYRLACDYIAHTDSVVTNETLSAFVQAFQSKRVLMIGEIWAIPIMLRLALVENLRRLAESVLQMSKIRQKAERICDEVIDSPEISGTEMLMQLVRRASQNPDLLRNAAPYMVRRLRSKGSSAQLSLQWVDEQLREKGIDFADLTRQQQQAQASDQISVGNCVTALKTIGRLNWREWFESVSFVDRILSEDPLGVYSTSDFITRDRYRHEIEKIARQTKKSETQVAETAVALCREEKFPVGHPEHERTRHVGYFLIDSGAAELQDTLGFIPTPLQKLAQFIKENGLLFYLGSAGTIAALLLSASLAYSADWGGSLAWAIAWSFVFLIPASELGLQFTQWLATKLLFPRALPKLNFEFGVPDSARGAVVVHTIVGDREHLENTLQSLEIRAIGNLDSNIAFGVLADLSDSPTEVLAGDRGILIRAKELIDSLNARYCAPGSEQFFIFFRKRQFNAAEGKYMGWERKRGKLAEFNRYLLGSDDTSLELIAGRSEFLRSVRYIITLDNDTRLPPGVARKLLGAIAHPLNHPIFDEKTRVVRKGYSIIQPRVGITLESANSSLFASISSGQSGLDPYTNTVSDLYQDLFREASYIGKGVYDVRAFETALHDRFPENSILSHDLIESCFARCGLASDIEVFDDFPQRYHAHAKRQHRWMRGDWQLLPWLGGSIPSNETSGTPSPLSPLSKWKLLDNLRRSMLPVTWLISLVSVWCFAPGDSHWWHALLFLVIGFPLYSLLWQLVFNLPIGYSFSVYFAAISRDVSRTALSLSFQILLIPHQTYLALDAAIRTIYRLTISREKLLEWETAQSAERRLRGTIEDFFRAMAPAFFVLSLVALSLYLFADGLGLVIGLFFLALWSVAPGIAYWFSKPRPQLSQVLSEGDQTYLKEIGFATWKYFEQYLKPEYNFLIPDNLQVVPEKVVAERTSPTNISLSLMATVSAYDLGFVPLNRVLERLKNIFSSVKQLEMVHGHLLNWYAIRDLRALHPRYVSSVDSGNFVGHLLTINSTLAKYLFLPLITNNHLEHLSRLISHLREQQPELTTALKLPQRVHSLAELIKFFSVLNSIKPRLTAGIIEQDLLRTIEELDSIRPYVEWSKHLEIVRVLGQQGLLPKKMQDIDRVLEGRLPSPSLIAKIINRLIKLDKAVVAADLPEPQRIEFVALIESLKTAQQLLSSLEHNVSELLSVIRELVEKTDFNFLYDPQKKLLSIGYNVENGQKDNSSYDLLASEARLASLVGIAKGDLPQTHWFFLNRALTDSAGGKALVSWSGTMFEYLMPLLVTKDFPSTLLSDTYRTVVKAQRVYGRKRNVPWGISESAYGRVDFENTYQYRAFGVPGLGLKRGLVEDLVISPYSSALALQVDASSAVTNLRRLEADGVRGEYGFFESVDYTPERLRGDETSHIVKSFFAHHQGMALVAINNVLNADIFQQRFHDDPRIKACELLLQEKFPTRIPLILPHQAEVLLVDSVLTDSKSESREHIKTPHTAYPQTHVLSNSELTVVVDNAGSGFTCFNSELALNRWREDALKNSFGHYIYIRDRRSKDYWSASYQPTKAEPESYEVIFAPDKAEFRRRDKGINTVTEITVSPEDNVEIRRVTVTNTSDRFKELDVTSYFEVALASFRADAAHPAFSKMFIEVEFLSEYDAFVVRRKPRSDGEREQFLAHLVCASVVFAPTEFDGARESFIGRGRSSMNPITFESTEPLGQNTGTTLDPICAIRQRVEVAPSESQTVSFVTGVAETRDELLFLIQKYREQQSATRAFELAWSHTNVEIRHHQFSRGGLRDFQRLANAILFNIESLRGPQEMLKRCGLPQTGLWRLGISGDEPIVIVSIEDSQQAPLCQELLLCHEYLRQRGIRFDLVILNEYAGGYFQDLQQELEGLVKTSFSNHLIDQRGGIFLRGKSQVSEEELCLLFSAARVVLYGSRGSLGSQLEFFGRPEFVKPVRNDSPRRPRSKKSTTQSADSSLEFFNGVGGFTQQGNAYRMTVGEDSLPPLPWSNVIGNPAFGFLVTETGAGFTWANNSRENRLSPWSNDAVSDPHGEVIYLRDQESGEFWCPTPLPVPISTPTTVTHGFGYSQFANDNSKIQTELTISSSPSEPVKWWHLAITNTDTKKRTLEVFLYFEWVLGVSRQETYRMVRSHFDAEREVLMASNPYSIDFANQVVFLGSNLPIQNYTANRKEFLGRNGDLSSPQLLDLAAPGPRSLRTANNPGMGVLLSNTTGAGFDSCAVIKTQIQLTPGQQQHVLFFVAKAEDTQTARSKVSSYRSLVVRERALQETNKFWNELTGKVQIKTPDRKFDILMNGWLLYQTLSCRMFARTGFYQSSGALGFRDQLQDSLALLWAMPELTKSQILLHASHQFPEGDVQHWWHPPANRGIRSRISDNYLWLPYSTLEYVLATGESAILDESIGFLDGPTLAPDQHDLYFTPQISSEVQSLYEHCVRALDRALAVGPHGLPLMGSGDWNDGMNLIGVHGQGESVWLAWFLAHILERFAPVCEQRGDASRAKTYREHSTKLVSAIEANAWDGAWYRRAFFDDGTAVGSNARPECKIDSLAQSWSEITALGNPDRRRLALESAYEHLFDRDLQLIRLLTPAFEHSKPNPGYIQSYPPGIRENGGQYTHGSAWLIMAALRSKNGTMGFDLFNAINPISHGTTPEIVARYQTEPYVTCGDVYTHPLHAGRGGWSWYTGSSGWLYRIGLEELVGLKRTGNTLSINPCIPAAWDFLEIHYSHRDTIYVIRVENPQGIESGVARVLVEGEEQTDKSIPLVENSGKIQVIVELGN